MTDIYCSLPSLVCSTTIDSHDKDAYISTDQRYRKRVANTRSARRSSVWNEVNVSEIIREIKREIFFSREIIHVYANVGEFPRETRGVRFEWGCCLFSYKVLLLCRVTRESRTSRTRAGRGTPASSRSPRRSRRIRGCRCTNAPATDNNTSRRPEGNPNGTSRVYLRRRCTVPCS